MKTKKTIAKNRQQAIKKEMEEGESIYNRKTDSLKNAGKMDTIPTKHNEIAVIAKRKKTASLLKLQREYDYLESKLNKH